eukprot:444434_1
MADKDNDEKVDEKGDEKTEEMLDEIWKSQPIAASTNANIDEKILFGKELGDRRHKIEKPWDSKKSIIKCIGALVLWYGAYKTNEKGHKTNEKRRFIGTGTVFHIQNGTIYVITCGHVVMGVDDNGKETLVKTAEFHRKEADGKNKVYPLKVVALYDKYTKVSATDLALLSFEEDDGYYANIFKEKRDIVHCSCSDDIDDDVEPIKYGIYGYPGGNKKKNPYTKAVYGEMWGMDAWSLDKNDTLGIDLYVTRNKAKDMFAYNGMDTEGGQSGSAIFITSKTGTIEIVGVHVGALDNHAVNLGVALNKDKINWILENIPTAEWVQFDDIPNGFTMLPGVDSTNESAIKYIGRIPAGTSLAVGQVIKDKGLWYPYDWKEMVANEGYEVLVVKNVNPFKWIWVHNKGKVPSNAVKGGHAYNGVQGFIGRCKIEKDVVIGKAYSDLGIWIPYGGKEIIKDSFECLCYK